jgi:hypothetical protein
MHFSQLTFIHPKKFIFKNTLKNSYINISYNLNETFLNFLNKLVPYGILLTHVM